MAELLLEIFSEEIPARMQEKAAADLQRLVTEGLEKNGLKLGASQAYATPRRLALMIESVPTKSPAISDERKGPRVGAPEKAVAGFMKAAGLTSIDDAQVVSDSKKGDYYVARTEKPGRAATEIVSELLPDLLRKFPWPKSMRWGDGDFSWVRPLQKITCLLDGKVVPFEVAGVSSGQTTQGHRFHGSKAIKVKNFEDYGTKLRDNKVLLPTSERAEMIGEQARALASAAGLELIEDRALMKENAGLTEWPTVLLGSFDEEFLAVPAECLSTSMKSHQKCFSLVDPKTGKLAAKFMCVSNLIATDDGAEIIAGNEKVIRARLADAKFFWDQDLKRPLDEMAASLADITFHQKLGTQKERVERIADLAFEISGAVDADPEDARRAAQLCKADLVSEMVGEFPELQGLMGRYYAEAAKAKPEIAAAIEDHYRPKGQSDDVPVAGVSVAVALADKIDTLAGFWSIDEKPTGSGDPYQLRRAALGVIRIVLENDLRVPLTRVFEKTTIAKDKETQNDLLAFFADRLKVYLRDQGIRHDLIDAVFALGGKDDLALVVKRVRALGAFLETDDGTNLLAGVKRASNILKAEEKKDKTKFSGEPEGPLLVEAAERDLAAALAKVKFDAKAAVDVENFEGAMRALSDLRVPVDKFFEDVTVNADDTALRLNRLKLLSEVREATRTIAEFSKIAG